MHPTPFHPSAKSYDTTFGLIVSYSGSRRLYD